MGQDASYILTDTSQIDSHVLILWSHAFISARFVGAVVGTIVSQSSSCLTLIAEIVNAASKTKKRELNGLPLEPPLNRLVSLDSSSFRCVAAICC
jgi:hypothetical protein